MFKVYRFLRPFRKLLRGTGLAFLVACVPDPAPEGEDTSTAAPQNATPEQLYQALCENCHDNPNTKAPSLKAMQTKSTASVAFTLFNGKMRTQAQVMSDEQKVALALFVTGDKEPYRVAAGQSCQNRSINLDTIYAVNRGFDERNSAAVGKEVSSLDSGNIARLKLKWVFELPDSSEARSQPVISQDTLFVAAAGGDVFALDRYSACIKWHYHSAVPLRTSLTLLTMSEHEQSNKPRSLLFVGDSDNFISAINALTGELVWRTNVAVSEYSILTGAVTASVDGLTSLDFLIVPVSLYEVVLAADPKHECCRAHGAVHRLNAVTGEIQWTTHMTKDATPWKKSRVGTQLWGPSGVPVWSTPTVDDKRGLVYVGTGENASSPATQLSDSVVALALNSGEVTWHFQGLAGDTWNSACSLFPMGSNCPARPGPDFDFGASVIIGKNRKEKDVLLAGQKSGDIYALDPDNHGELLWQSRVGSGSALGGVHWGMAVADGRLFAAANDPPYPGKLRRPGLYALDIESGDLLWDFAVSRDCETSRETYFQREELYPECSYYFAFSAALTIANDVIFVPAMDGKVRAFDTSSGALLWQFNTAQEFETTAGTTAHGGSMDNVGVQYAGNMVYMQSGYTLLGQLPGNVLLAFELDP